MNALILALALVAQPDPGTAGSKAETTAPTALPVVQVHLHASASVFGTSLELEELAHLTGDPVAIEAIRSTSLGYAPAPGHSRVLDARTITAQLRREVAVARLEVVGSPVCRVTVETEQLGADAAWDAARATLLERSPAGVLLTPLGQRLPIVVPRGETPARLEAEIAPAAANAVEWRVPVRIWVEDELYRTVWTRWRAECMSSIPVLARAIKRGEPITPADVRYEDQRVPYSTTEQPIEALSLLGAAARRDLPAGSRLRDVDLDRPYVVERGDLISLEVRRGPIVARTRVEVIQRGRLGDRVRVRSHSTGRELVARVVARELVQLNLSASSN